jgi:membrane protein involved in colicin uptake
MITEVIKVVADTSDANRKIDKLDNSLNTLTKSTSGVAKGMKESSVSVLENGGAMGLLNAVTGGYAQVAKDSVEALALFAKESKIATALQSAYGFVVGASTGAMKLFKLALAGTGIGLIILALVSLVLNFGKITDAVTKFLPGLKLVGDFFRTVANAVTDFIGITSEAERALDAFNEQAKKSLKQNEDYMQTRGDLLDDFSKKKVEAKNRYLKALEEEGLSESKRNELAKRLNRDLAGIDKERNDKKVKDNKDAQDKIDSDNKSINDKRKALQEKADAIAQAKRKAIEDARKAALDEANKIDEAARQDNLKNSSTDLENLTRQYELEREILIKNKVSTEEIELQFLNRANELKLKTAEANRLIEEKTAADKKVIDEKAIADELIRATAVKDAKIGLANNTLNLIAELAGRGSKIGKATAVAQATIAGYEGVQNAYTTAQKSPITTLLPAYPLIQAGLAGAFSAIQIKKILSTNAGGSTPPSSNTGGGGGQQAPSAPSFNLVQGTGANQIASSLGGQNQPVMAFVVSSAVTTAQALERNIISNSKF